MAIFHYEFKVQPESGHHPAITLGFAHVYIKASNLIEGRLRAQIVLQDAHFVVLERMALTARNTTHSFTTPHRKPKRIWTWRKETEWLFTLAA